MPGLKCGTPNNGRSLAYSPPQKNYDRPRACINITPRKAAGCPKEKDGPDPARPESTYTSESKSGAPGARNSITRGTPSSAGAPACSSSAGAATTSSSASMRMRPLPRDATVTDRMRTTGASKETLPNPHHAHPKAGGRLTTIPRPGPSSAINLRVREGGWGQLNGP